MSTFDKSKLPDYQEWRQHNDNSFSLYDYLHGIQSTSVLKGDFYLALFALIWPEFSKVDELIYLTEEITGHKLQKYIDEGYDNYELEYWINLVNLDGIIPGLTDETYSVIGKILESTWSDKLKKDFPEKFFKTQYIFEEEDGEHFITFNQI